MKKLFILTLLMVMAALIMPNVTNAQFGTKKNKSGDKEEATDGKKSKFGFKSGAEMMKKDKPNKLFTKIDDQMDLISSHKKSLQSDYGETFVAWENLNNGIEDMESADDFDKKGVGYQKAKEEQKALEESNAGFKKEAKTYNGELLELDGLTKKLVKSVTADFKEDYVAKYEKYAEKRPETGEIKLNPTFWGLVFNDPQKLNTLQNLVSLNSLIYGLSVVYTDLYFKNDKESAFLGRMQADWEGELTGLRKKEAPVSEIEIAYNAFANNAFASPEYSQILLEKENTRKQINTQLKETSFSALSLALNQLLGGSDLSSVQQPDTMSMKNFVVMVKDEGTKAKDVIDMLLKTSKGTSLVSRQAVKSCVVELKMNSQDKKSKAFIIENENIEVLVLQSGKEQRYEVVQKVTSDKDESLTSNLLEKESSTIDASSRFNDVTQAITSKDNYNNLDQVADDSPPETANN